MISTFYGKWSDKVKGVEMGRACGREGKREKNIYRVFHDFRA